MTVPEAIHLIPDYLVQAGRRLANDRQRLEEAKAIAKRAVIKARKAGVYEHVIAETVGVDRMTVRKWLGK